MVGSLIGGIGCFGLGCLIGVVLVSKVMSLLLKKFHDSTMFTIIGFVGGSILVLFFNYQIYNYYLYWANVPVEGVVINPVLPMAAEIPLGIGVMLLCAVGSYLLVRLERKNRKPVEEENKKDQSV